MLIGTLSTEKRRGKSVLSGGQRRECAAQAVERFAPDLLICAGHSLKSVNDLASLARDARVRRSKTAVIVEVQNDRSFPKGDNSGHCLYVVLPGGKKERLGRQIFAESWQLKGTDGAELLARLARDLPKRTFKFKNKSITVLACGEINTLHGRNKPALGIACKQLLKPIS